MVTTSRAAILPTVVFGLSKGLRARVGVRIVHQSSPKGRSLGSVQDSADHANLAPLRLERKFRIRSPLDIVTHMRVRIFRYI
ncbi:hypothetical protein [Plantibacter sp. 2H11-2]|uniref:hypothetical protein n=1 Tax=Plantibacter sp. 2H11-2 TaxID=3414431 RepID=UPI003CEE36A2